MTTVSTAPARHESLRDIVRRALAESINVDQYTLTTCTLAAVPPERRADYFEEMLPVFLRSVIVTERPKSRPPATPRPMPVDSAPGGAPSKPARSAKVAAIRNDWQRHLDAIYSTADGNKRLRDFTVEDLRGLATINPGPGTRQVPRRRQVGPPR